MTTAHNKQKRYKVEICCASAEDVILAARAGADRVELTSAMFLGGLTPSLGELIVAKRHAPHMPAMCMVRPREGGFCYTEREFETAMEDARVMLQHGADGLVFGFLNDDGTIDIARTSAMVERAGGAETVFHRAFDVTPDWRTAMDQLIELRVTRILTSGQSPSAYLGAETIAEMVRYAEGRIEILPGAGIRPGGAGNFLLKTGCDQVHMSLHKKCRDESTRQNPDIHFGGALYPPEDSFKLVDAEALTRFLAK